MRKNDEEKKDMPTIRIRAAGDAHVTTFHIPTGSKLFINGAEVV